MNSSVSASREIICLYKKVPEYSEVKHLGSSEFINKIEKLKQEFREIRSTLLEDPEDIDWLSESTREALQINPERDTLRATNKSDEIKSRNISRTVKDIINSGKTSTSYLSVRRCDIHKNPAFSGPVMTVRSYRPVTAIPSSSTVYSSQPELACRQNRWSYSTISTISDSLSSSSSSPDIITFRRKEYFPPQNVENRLLLRKSVEKKAEIYNSEEKLEPERPLIPNRIPSAVTKPLYEKIVNQNSKRSLREREQRKQKLMSQMKPFSFSTTTEPIQSSAPKHTTLILNNSQFSKLKKPPPKVLKNFKTHNNSLEAEGQRFRAKPAPPRSRALMAALRLQEQQEYRELKKQLRSEALMKMSALPPRMAARSKNRSSSSTLPVSSSTAFRHTQISEKQNNDRNSTSSEDELESENSDREISKILLSRSLRGSQASGISNSHKRSKSVGVFESTSNDNVASRLRVAAAKKKEQERIRQEKIEKFKLLKEDAKRYKLRSYHSDVWRRACSYSANHDIAMRRELRHAAAILESHSFKMEMASMLDRVQSAPLLLEGVRERRFQPCKKHQSDFGSNSASARKTKTGNNRSSCFYPNRYSSSRRENKPFHAQTENSETEALAEGSLTSSSDNEIENGENQKVMSTEKPLVITENNAVKGYDNDGEAIEKGADAIIGSLTTE